MFSIKQVFKKFLEKVSKVLGRIFSVLSKMHNRNMYQVIPSLCQTNKDLGSYTSFSHFWAYFLSPAERVWPESNFFPRKKCTTTILISCYQICVKRTKISEVISVLVIFGRVFNPLLRGCGRGQNFFSAKDAQPQYLSVDTKFVSNEQRFWKLYQF